MNIVDVEQVHHLVQSYGPQRVDNRSLKRAAVLVPFVIKQGELHLVYTRRTDEVEHHPHLAVEMRCIEAALEREIPLLGICLGAQLLATTLGAEARPMRDWEMGWHDIEPTHFSARLTSDTGNG